MKYNFSLFLVFILSSFSGFFVSFGQTPARQSVTFALLTDLHVNPGSESDSALQMIVSEINTMKVDFTIVSGDISNTGSDKEIFAVKRAIDKLKQPCYLLPGNHETNWSESAGLTFNKLWGDDRFIFKKNGYLFVGFNTGPYMKMGDGQVKQEDLQWLKRQLQQKKLSNDILVSISHYPLSYGLDNWVEVTGILKSFCCRLSFCGHGHKLSLLNFDGIPGIMGRSSLSGPASGAGFNLVTLRNDSVYVYNKEVSIALKKPAVSLNYLHPDTLAQLPVSPKPDFSVNEQFKNVKIVSEWNDTASVFSGPCLVFDTILIYGNSLGWVKGINTLSGKVMWQRKLEGPLYSTPVALGGTIILGTVDGFILAMDALNGKQLWKVNTGRPVLAEGVVDNGQVYIGGGDKNFYKIDIKTGKVMWKFSGIEGLVQGKPAISDSVIVFGAWDKYLYCLNKQSGNLNWKWSNNKPQVLYSPGNIFPVISGRKIFIVAPDRYMTAIDIKTGKEVWRTGIHQVRESMGESPDGSMIYAKLMNDTLIAISATENYPKTLWAVDAGFGYEHNPCPVTATSQLVVAVTRSGTVIGINPVSKTVIWKFKAGNSSVNKVIVDKNKTFWFTLLEGKIMGIKQIVNN